MGIEPSDAKPANGQLMVLMFTDVVDSSRLKREVGAEAWRDMAMRHDQCLRAAMELAPSGRIFQDNGDGYFAGFSKVADAVNAALIFQSLLRAQAWPAPLSSRVGLHLGEIEVTQNEATGLPKFLAAASDMAARLMSVAHGGQVLLTRAVFDEARQRVRAHPRLAEQPPPPLRWVAHGLYQFKGNDDPMEVFEVGAEGAAPFSAPPDSEKGRRHIRPGEEESLGWRPAIGLELPGEPSWLFSEKLGVGGFGEVWLLNHRKTQSPRVLKFCFDVERLRALKREVTLFRLLKGALGERPDIARIIDFHFDSPPYFIEMDFARDGNLAQWAQRQGGIGNIPMEQRLKIIVQIGQALSAAHSVAVLHKDLKPSNVLMVRDAEGRFFPRLTDFGIGILTDHTRLADLTITPGGMTTGKIALNESGASTTRMYAPPESLLNQPHTVQGDVFALGVIFYQVYVGDLHRPLASGWEREISDDVVREDIAACVEGDPKLRIASVSEVVQRVQKEQERREQRQKEAAARAEAQAARQRAAERARKRLRRRVMALILALVLAIVGYAGYEWYLQWGDWIEVAHYDFTNGKGTTDGLEFIAGTFAPYSVAAWPIGPNGLEARYSEWCVFKNVHVRGDVRIVAEVSYGAEPDGFELCLNSGTFGWRCPPGYSAQVGARKGQSNYISRNEQAAWPDESEAKAANIQPKRTATITFERQGENVTLQVDKETPIRRTDVLPLTGKDLNGVAIRSWSRTIVVRSIAIYRRSLPKKASPVIAGDKLVEAGDLDAAVHEYENIADDYPHLDIGEKALVKAFKLSTILQPADVARTDRLRDRFVHDYPRSDYRKQILETDIMGLWQGGQYDPALDKLAEAQAINPETRLPLRLLSTARMKHVHLSPTTAAKLMHAIRLTPDVNNIDISELGVESLADVARPELRMLNFNKNQISSLEPLRGLPLEHLSAIRTAITSLEPLRGAKLQHLNISDTEVADLGPVRGMPLRNFNCAFTGVSDLQPLAGNQTRMSNIVVDGTRITTVEALRGLQVDLLSISYCAIQDLSPLAGMPLQTLGCAGCGLTDLGPIHSLPLLNDLNCSFNHLQSLEPLRGMKIQKLDCRGNQIRSLDPLRGMPLIFAEVQDNPLTTLEPLVEKPPPHFLFDSDTIPDAELIRVRDIWQKRADCRQHARDAAILLALRKNDIPALKQLADAFRGHRYLIVPKCLTWDESAARCRALGGHLVSITSAEENAFVAQLCRGRGFGSWIGLRRDDDKLSWETGEPVTFEAFGSNLAAGKLSRYAVMAQEGWFISPEWGRAQAFIIEWD